MNIIENKNNILIQMQNSDKLYIQHPKSGNIVFVNIKNEKIVISELDYKNVEKINNEIIKNTNNMKKNKSERGVQ